MEDLKNLSEYIIKEAKKRGADEVDVIIANTTRVSIDVRLGKIEELKQANPKSLGIRILKNKKTARTHTSDFRKDSIRKLIKQTVEMTDYISQDEFSGLPSEDLLGKSDAKLELYDEKVPGITTEEKISMLRRMEQIGMEQSDLITNSEGAGWSDSKSKVILANSSGFFGEENYTSCSMSLSLIAEKSGVKQTDYWSTTNRFLDKLEPLESGAKEAARRTVRKVGSRKPRTKKVPVVFDPIAGSDLLSILATAALGSSIYKRNTFLIDKLNTKIAIDELNLIDDGIMLNGIGSRSFDDEGLPSRVNKVIGNGVLKSYLCDCYSARKIGHPPTGSASRSTRSDISPSHTNFYMQNGNSTPGEIIGSVKDGLYLTSVHWVGVNYVTGDYSRGAEGVWIKNGKLSYPVQEFTVAGNILDMLNSIEMIGNDLKFRGSINAPTFLIKDMMVSGR